MEVSPVANKHSHLSKLDRRLHGDQERRQRWQIHENVRYWTKYGKSVLYLGIGWIMNNSTTSAYCLRSRDVPNLLDNINIGTSFAKLTQLRMATG